MPETRVVEQVFKDGVLVKEITAEIADEQLAEEADTARLKEICDMGHSAIKVPTLVEGFVLLCKRLGYI